MSDKKHKHHFVPRFLLKGFVDEENPPSFWLYDKKLQSTRSVAPSDAGCETDFYAFPRIDGTRDTNSLEDALSDVESMVAAVLRKVIGGESLTNEDRSAVSFFLALMMTRVPNFRSNIEGFAAQSLREIAMFIFKKKGALEDFREHLRKQGKHDVDDEFVESAINMLKSGEIVVKIFPHYSIEHFCRLALDLAPIFHQMTWTVMRADKDYRFVTSDNPLAVADPLWSPTSSAGVGLMNNSVEVTFPLTQRVALLAGWRGFGQSYLKASDGQVRAVNLRTAANANRFVYAPFRSDGFARKVWKLQGTSPRSEPNFIRRDDSALMFFKSVPVSDGTSIARLVKGHALHRKRRRDNQRR